MAEKYIQRIHYQVALGGLKVQVNHRGLYVAMTQKLLYGVDVDARVEKVRGKAVTQRVGFMLLMPQPGVLVGQPYRVLYGTCPHRFANPLALEKVNRGLDLLVAVICPERFHHALGKQRVAILATLAATYQQAVVLAVNVSELQRAQFIESQPRTVKQLHYGFLLGAAATANELLHLLLGEVMRKLVLALGIELGGYVVRALQYVPEEKGNALGNHLALAVRYPVNRLEVVHVVYNVGIGPFTRRNIGVVRAQVANLPDIRGDAARRVVASNHHLLQELKSL